MDYTGQDLVFTFDSETPVSPQALIVWAQQDSPNPTLAERSPCISSGRHGRGFSNQPMLRIAGESQENN